MNKTKLVVSFAVCGLVLVSGVSTSLAAPTVTAGPDVNTKGTILWEAEGPGAPGVVIKPETPDVVIKPETGGQTTGPLRIQHVPDFDFGKQTLATGAQNFNPIFEPFKYEGTQIPSGANVNDVYAIPHFIQVTDNRGTHEGWKLLVKSTTFKTTDSTEEMPNATITLGESRLTNTIYDSTEIANRVATFNGDTNDSLVIPTGVDSVTVMATKGVTKATSTNGTQTSLVLSKTYDKDKLDYLSTDLNKDVIFTKTNSDVAVTGKAYEATITWTLESGL